MSGEGMGKRSRRKVKDRPETNERIWDMTYDTLSKINKYRLPVRTVNESAWENTYSALNKKNEPKVMVGISSRRGLSLETAQCLFNSGLHKHFDRILVEGSPHVDQSRNAVTRAFLDSDCDYLLWVDDDVVLFPAGIKELIDSIHTTRLNNLAPVCFVVVDGMPFPGVYHWRDNHMIRTFSIDKWLRTRDMLAANGRRPIIQADLVGGGCWIGTKELYERTVDEHGEWWRLNWEDEGGNMRRGEDLYFFRRMENESIKFNVHLGVECGHMKPADVRAFMHIFYFGPPKDINSKKIGYTDSPAVEIVDI